MFNRFTLDFAWSYNLKNFRATGHRYLGWNKGCLSPWRTVLSAINPANQPLEKTKEFLCKPAEEQNQRLTTGTRSPLHSWMQTSRLTPICLCKPFSSQGCPGTMYAARHIQDVLDLSNAKLGCTTGGSGEVVQRAALAAPSWGKPTVGAKSQNFAYVRVCVCVCVAQIRPPLAGRGARGRGVLGC